MSETSFCNGGSHIGFLGGAIPFYFVQAGKDNHYEDYVTKPRQPIQIDDATSIMENEMPSFTQDSRALSDTRLALCVTISLSKASFFRHYDAALQKTITEDIKMDVFLNGELCASTYVSERHCTSDPKEFIQRFSGRRIDRLIERPWILKLPSHAADVHSDRAYSAEERWDEIGKMVELQATRLGGKTTILGEYLSHLADMEMPAEMKTMRLYAGLKLAVVDVVTSTGRGRKNEKQDDPWLKAPTPMRLERPSEAQTSNGMGNAPRITRRTPVLNGSSQKASSSGLDRLSAVRLRSAQHITGSTPAGISQPASRSHFPPQTLHSPRWRPTSKWHAAPTRVDAQVVAQSELIIDGPRTRGTRKSETVKAESPPGSTRKPLASSPTPAPRLRTTQNLGGSEEQHGDPPAKRQRMRYHDVFDNKLTLSEEIDMAEAAGREGHGVCRLPKHIETKQDITPVAISIATDSQDTLKTKPPPTAPHTSALATKIQPPRSRTRDPVYHTHPTPSLSDDCMISYADERVRQIKMERSGWFSETGILMGARFLIG